jgi:2-oxo-3-hexenedioate decarboxylase
MSICGTENSKGAKKKMIDINRLANEVDTAAYNARAIEQISAKKSLGVLDAYAVQKASVAKRLDRGEKLVGIKMGFTSRAKMVQMGVDNVIWGHLTDIMSIPDGGEIEYQNYVHPRVEPELAFMLKKPLVGKVTMLEALDAIEAVAPAMEIIDSRYRDFKFSLVDVIADNSSSSSFVVGPWSKSDVELSNLGMLLEVDGRVVEVGSTAAILGDPLRSLVEASRLMGEHDMQLEAGWIVMAGAATAAYPLSPGVHIRAEVEELGRVSFGVN